MENSNDGVIKDNNDDIIKDNDNVTKSNDEVVFIQPQLDPFVKADVQHIVEEMPWMKNKSIALLHEKHAIETYIDRLIKQGIAALDLETTGLSTRIKPNGSLYTTIVGVCLAANKDDGVYISAAHKDTEYNVSLGFILEQIKRLAANCVLIFHNVKYDAAILRNYGIIIGGDSYDESMFEDTIIMSAVQDASRKMHGLKHLSDTLLQRKMLEIKGLGVTVSDDNIPAFDEVPPEKAVYYGAPDAMNTFYLYEFFKALIDKMDPDKRQGPWGIYKIEKKCMFVTMEMERNYVRLDIDYLKKIKVDLEKKSSDCVRKIWEAAGRQFDVASPKQLGTVLFDELKLPYPEVKDLKKKTEGYGTSEIVLEKIQDKHPIITQILDFRGYQKYLSTYIDNLLNNADENGEVKFELNQIRADTGRYSATGGKGLKLDGYCKVNCQNLPRTKKDDPKAVDIRKALIPRPGYKIVAVDYSGEELRIAANLSKEPKWLEEFLHGSKDLHTATAKIIYNKPEVTKDERNCGKTLNFATVYGGGPAKFSALAKIPLDRAKRMIYNFFKEYHFLRKWIDNEMKIARKRGYSRTPLGRRRPLTSFYNSIDENIRKKGDRCAVNSTIQGGGSDIIKIALHRVSKWIRENGFQDKIRILIPIHDEIVYEIKNNESEEDRATFGYYLEEISKLMIIDDIITNLNWPVHLEVDAEYGDSFSVDHDYFKEKKMQKASNTNVLVESTNKGNTQKNEEVIPKKLITTNVCESKEMRVVTIQHPAVQNTSSYQFEADIRMKFLGEDDLRLAKEILAQRVLEEAKEIPSEVSQNLNLKDFIDKNNYLSWDISNFDTVVAKQINLIIELLDKFSSLFSGPKCYIKLIDKEGEVLYTSPKKVSVDAFISLCLWLNI